ncbi:MAG TPA: HAD family hydrolase [Mycobacteriales bacterium]|nr:HAD family hydrolase [Mycobacteriales bacterium]
MPIRAVYFDGDQTLWDFRLVMRRALRATLAELRRLRPGPATDALTVEDLVADRERTAAEMDESNLERLRCAAFARTLRRIGLPDGDLAEQLNDFYLQRRFSGVEPYPDVLPVLRALRGAVLLGLLSNGNGYPERSGLGGIFDAVVFSQDHRIGKPDRRLFDIAAREIGAPGAEIVMIGDSVENDVRGAQNAGWSGIWLNRDGVPTPEGIRPDAIFADLSGLPGYLNERATM